MAGKVICQGLAKASRGIAAVSAIGYHQGLPAQYLHTSRPGYVCKPVLDGFIGNGEAALRQRVGAGHGGSGVLQLVSAQEREPQAEGAARPV